MVKLHLQRITLVNVIVRKRKVKMRLRLVMDQMQVAKMALHWAITHKLQVKTQPQWVKVRKQLQLTQ